MRATQFRRWATSVLHEFSLKGYVLDRKRIENGAFIGEDFFRTVVMGVMELEDAAIATSGDYRHRVEHQGRSYAHTINGTLREPSSSRLAAVSVVAASCVLADAWATALLVLGEKAGIELARARGMTALFALHDGDGFLEIPITDGELSANRPG